MRNGAAPDQFVSVQFPLTEYDISDILYLDV